uniref:Secreted protein n=1 Tax=Arundo donax TaxID=35708 RepID=A0A0A8ZW21_ARUDO
MNKTYRPKILRLLSILLFGKKGNVGCVESTKTQEFSTPHRRDGSHDIIFYDWRTYFVKTTCETVWPWSFIWR